MIRPPPRSPLLPYTTLSRSPPALKTNDQGNLIPTEALINILISIIKNPTEIEDFKKAYLEDPRLKDRSEEHTSELQSQSNLVCRLLLEKKKKQIAHTIVIYH